jgi:hypothetical protein
VYTSREIIQEKLRENVRRGLGANLNKLVQPEAMEQPDPKNYNDSLQYSIQVLDTLVLSIELPPAIVGAINRQTEQFYLIQEYRHRVAREAEESKRKQIEANGIAAFQKTVSQGISDSYLRWRGIEATLALAQSQNSKVVVIGSGKDGLPIILGNVDGPAAPASLQKGGAAPPTNENAPNSQIAPQAAPQDGASSSNANGAARPGQPPGQGQAPGQAPPGAPRNDNSAPLPDKMPPGARPSTSANPDKPTSFNLFDLSNYDSVLSRIIGAPRRGDSDGSAKQAVERE